MKCNNDCFHCIYDDCIMETTRRDAMLSHEIDVALQEINRDAKQSSTGKRDLEANRKWQKEYRANNREKVRRLQMESYYRHWDAAQKRNAEYRRRNKEKYAEAQKCIKEARKRRGLTQKQAAEILGITQNMLCSWERGTLAAKWELLYSIFPELEDR